MERLFVPSDFCFWVIIKGVYPKMTEAEEKERGVLTIDVKYIQFAQKLTNLIYMAQRLKDELDMKAIERGMMEKERRVKHDRRKDDR